MSISLNATNRLITFSVTNKKGDHQKDKTGGIGLNNAKRRLALLAAGKYDLAIDDTDTHYSVKLNLKECNGN